MELLALFAAIDEWIRSIPGDPAPAELFMLRAMDGGIALRFLWSGVARELPETVVPEPDLLGLVLATGGWAAPLGEGRPSKHRDRRRVRILTLVAGAGAVVTRLEAEGEAPQLLEGGEGDVPELLRRCWSRRPDAREFAARARDL
jgi:hypothetical protein